MGRDLQFAGQDHWTCIRCGLCIEVCPTYAHTLDEGLSPRGRVNLIHALVTASRSVPTRGAKDVPAVPAVPAAPAADAAPSTAVGEVDEGSIGAVGETASEIVEPTWRELARGGRALLDLCLLCRACEATCPSGVPYGRMMGEVRAWLIPRRPRSGDRRVRSWLRGVFMRPWYARLVLGQVKLAVRLHLADLLVRSSASPEHQVHYLALLESLRVRVPVAGALERATIPGAPSSHASALPAAVAAAGVRGGKVLVFRGCLTPVFFPAVLEALHSVLEKLGVDHETPRRQVCCGALHRQHGLLEEARTLARKNIMAFEAEGDPMILVESSHCAAALLDYADLLSGDTEYAERARRFSARVRDSAKFLADVMASADGSTRTESALPAPADGIADAAAVMAQEPCHLRHGQRHPGCLSSGLVALGLAQPDAVPEADLCCGGAGLYSLVEPAMSAQLGEHKADLLATGRTGLVITSDFGCRLQLQGRLARRGVAMLHMAEVCDRRWK
jgi:glycolate oxidase iron-sulfur subunit